jgi:uncharacterized membrane protein
MKNKILLSVLFLLLVSGIYAQQQPDTPRIRIVESLSKQERMNRHTVILRAELDSMIQLYNASQPPVQPRETVKETVMTIPSWIMVIGGGLLLVIGLLCYLLFDYHKRLSGTIADLKRLIRHFEFYTAAANGKEPGAKMRPGSEKKISELHEELEKQKKSNQLLQQEYESVKKAIAESFKVKNYPAYDKAKNEEQIIKDLLATERAVTIHAFEKYLKPVIQIADANKNNPAKISDEDSQKMLELLISLSLYYIEYLYLRVNDLAVGGNIVQRTSTAGVLIRRY